uniref:Protein CUSTOS n=1 Tax=Laticauda laticaudata TaxID=8630 RepID=A0A8C5WY11_LATLA
RPAEAFLKPLGGQKRPQTSQKSAVRCMCSEVSLPAALVEKICNHEQDGNELQTTPEFQAHVAKKLDMILDKQRCSLENSRKWQRCQEIAVTAADILKQSGLPPPVAQDSGQTIEAAWKKVKKKKKKGKREENGQTGAIEAVSNSQNKELSCPSSPEAISWTETKQRKRKRKRRKTETLLSSEAKSKLAYPQTFTMKEVWIVHLEKWPIG